MKLEIIENGDRYDIAFDINTSIKKEDLKDTLESILSLSTIECIAPTVKCTTLDKLIGEAREPLPKKPLTKPKRRNGEVVNRRDDVRSAIVDKLKSGPKSQTQLIKELGDCHCDIYGILRRMKNAGIITMARADKLPNSPTLLSVKQKSSDLETQLSNEEIEEIIKCVLSETGSYDISLDDIKKLLEEYDKDVLVDRRDYESAIRDAISRRLKNIN